jgi:ribokinase
MPSGRDVQVAVVGHLEWVEFARAPRLPHEGEIVEAEHLCFEPAGGGAVAAVQLARLAAGALFVTALGEDAIAVAALERLRALDVEPVAATRSGPTRRALTLSTDGQTERTILTLGERLEPSGEDARLPWRRLAEMDAVYFTAGDLAALRWARAARVLVASPRAGSVLDHGVPLDALVFSRGDRSERQGATHAQAQAELLVCTDGARGGTWRRRDHIEQATWAAATPPGPALDSYGCGDSFAAGLTYGLALGLAPAGALALAARCGAACLTGQGPYQVQLTREQLQ